MRIFCLMSLLLSFNAQAENIISKCSNDSNGFNVSVFDSIEKSNNKMKVEYTYYSGPNCKKGNEWQKDVIKGSYIEEHDFYLVIIEEARSIPLDQIQKDWFEEEPGMIDQQDGQTIIILKEPKLIN